MRHAMLLSLVLLTAVVCPGLLNAEEPVDFRIEVKQVLTHAERDYLWYHPRVAALPGLGKDGGPAVLMTLQKHLNASDHYTGSSVLRTDDRGTTWTKPEARPELDWVAESAKVDVAVADVTPGWHAKTGTVLAVGALVRYSKGGDQLEDRPRSNQTSYAVFDPKTGRWLGWRRLEMPPDEKFNYARSACSQFVVRPDGAVLLPFYFGRNQDEAWGATVVECSFDGRDLKYVRHGTEHVLKVVRGLAEPSVVVFNGRYFLTVRNDLKGYVSVSADGLKYEPLKPWTFDDGADLGSYNTQQHWLAHSEGLFLIYTRRGANNDHIIRHRAPLFIARVEPEKLQVLRRTERVLIPERGAEMGNFGATAIDAQESWVTVAEGVWDAAGWKKVPRPAVLAARVIWSKPNRLTEK